MVTTLVSVIVLKMALTTTYRSAKKSALDDLVSQIKVNVSSTSVLSQLEVDRKLQEQYEQIIQTTAADEIEEFELVDAWEDPTNYWVYYRLSISRYRQIKEEQKEKCNVSGN
jgi:arginine repressor